MHVTTGSGRPAAVTVKLTVAEHWPASLVTVMSLGNEVNTGGASPLSRTVTLKLHVAVPAEFDAVHVTVLTPIGNWNGELIGTPSSVELTTGAGRPATPTVKLTSAEDWPASLVTVMSPGHDVNTGASITVTLKLHVAKPTEFDAVHVTVLTPIGNLNGELIGTPPSVQVILGVGTPDAATVKFTSAEDWPASLVTVISPGQDENAGALRTVTLKLNVAVPTEFEAVQITVLKPIGNLKGEVIGTPPSVHVTTGAGIPDAATVKSTNAEDWPGSLVTVMSLGLDVNAGALSTVTLKLHVAVPTEFDAVHVTVLTPIGNLKGEVIGTPPSAHVTTGSGRPAAATVKFTSAVD
jgi:hypothetical protein